MPKLHTQPPAWRIEGKGRGSRVVTGNYNGPHERGWPLGLGSKGAGERPSGLEYEYC